MTETEGKVYDFDVALSFAGEDRQYVDDVASGLKVAGIRVFLDSDYLADTWGEDLVEFFEGVYRIRSRFAILFLSRHYAEKMWPREERRNALARAVEQRGAYVLPVRLDDTEIPGLRPTVGYLDTRRIGIEGLVTAFLAKLAGRSGGPGWSGDRAPRTTRDLAQVLAERPTGWEYLYFAGLLHTEREAFEDKYRDHEAHYGPPSGERVNDHDAIAYLRRALDDISLLVRTLSALMDPAVQERAFGAPGVAGDPERIRHLATRWTAVYGGLLAWSARLRGASKTAECEPAFEMLARFADFPLNQYREFMDRLLQEVDRLPHRIAAKGKIHVELTLVLTIDEELSAQLTQELARLAANLA